MKTYGGFLISQVKQLSSRVAERLLRDCGIDAFNGAQGRILYVLWEFGEMPITQVAKLTSLAKTSLTSMLDRMEASGVAERVPDPADRRKTLVRITDKARGYFEAYERYSEQANVAFYKGFTETEITEFEDKLRRIIKNLEGELDEKGSV